ncbi:hypothetical protein BDW22DRAFT_429792 [Trametopsis cervina]|nr:hypothetical protein BDW22DRAFT_429792 [Trametopsis cervina]
MEEVEDQFGSGPTVKICKLKQVFMIGSLRRVLHVGEVREEQCVGVQQNFHMIVWRSRTILLAYTVLCDSRSVKPFEFLRRYNDECQFSFNSDYPATLSRILENSHSVAEQPGLICSVKLHIPLSLSIVEHRHIRIGRRSVIAGSDSRYRSALSVVGTRADLWSARRSIFVVGSLGWVGLPRGRYNHKALIIQT